MALVAARAKMVASIRVMAPALEIVQAMGPVPVLRQVKPVPPQ